MRRWSLVLVLGMSSCADWRSLYGARPLPADALEDPSPPPDAAPVSDLAEPDDLSPDVADEVIPSCPDSSGPLVLWKFDGMGPPSPAEPIRDMACRPPDVPLGWDLERAARDTNVADHALFLDGGFLFSGIPQSDEVGRAILHSRSLSLELWVRAERTGNGTIFSTAGGTNPGRAFAISQKDGTLRFAVRSTATDADGSRFVAGGPAEAVAPFAFDPAVPVHIVATYGSADRMATLYVDGAPTAAVMHGHAGVAVLPVWASGKNELGLGGTFEGAPWRGWVYLVAIYDRALGADEVRALFARGPQR
jgi:hypothetical protein